MAKHPFHSIYKRAFYSFLLIAFIMTIGTLGMHWIEQMPYVDAFYFMSMITTAQGSTYTPITFSGKIFASIMAFISVGAGVAAMGFLFGPFMGKLWHIGVIKLEEELHYRPSARK